MTLRVTPAGRLSADQVISVLRAATLAPSTHNTQPWLFTTGAEGIELYADADRVLPIADADRRELLISCGAALFNLRTAIHALGVHPDTTVFPRRDEPDLLAVVRPRTATPVDRRLAELAQAIPRRHTNRTPFGGEPVPPSTVGLLRHAAEAEQAWLPQLDENQLTGLRELVHESHLLQERDPAFGAEWRRWTGRAPTSRDGVPFAAGGSTVADDTWVLRDFGDPAARALAAPPLVVVVGSFGDTPADRLRAGQAMQRVLLTATANGLDASFISQPVEVRATRVRLRHLLGDGLWPQIVLRIGHGSPVARTPRRALADVLLEPPSLTA
ncbi:nitroreductase family protein [Amycolatopsis sp. FDAARGOS 1241]|uniref:Acg family FMN-binding oxidoreductase n=1 Tax=Amycolatopsis sp. FDAARGOS 1241 TaxID=2778070 RepID=UPI001950E8F3|nr:nitroreductase family protein [Amycolatopsis sp. FDAARGOS 1241]QRP49417.1 nitroreductase family protein [Amycolatopsis sp. FDAARGOS 1241]